MNRFEDLISAYTASGLSSQVVKAWYAASSPSGERLSALAENIGSAFLAGRVNFASANGLLNQLMPLAGFESAPKRFWQYYIAFENSETADDPDTNAKAAVAALARAGSV